MITTKQQDEEINKRAYAGTPQATESLKRIEQKKLKTIQAEEILKDIALDYY